MKERLLLAVLALLSGLSPSWSQEPMLDGLWNSPSGAIYRFTQIGGHVVATYDVPSKAQVAAGIKQGDLALKGTYIDNVLTGTYYQRAPLEIQATCPEHQIIDVPVQWEFDGTSLSGSVLIVYGSDGTCAITRRALQPMPLERVPGDMVAKRQPASAGMPLPWPFPW
jgi:hypothetical protein